MKRASYRSAQTARRSSRGALWFESLEQRNLLAGVLAITELSYNPVAINPAQGDLLEFIEFQNVGDRVLPLNGITFDSGITYTFGNESLNPLEYAVIVRDLGEFTDLYPDPTIRILGQFQGGALNNNGERIRILDADGNELLDFDYSDSAIWPFAADGRGATLELIDPAGTTNKQYSKHYSWRSSTEWAGSPGRPGGGPAGVVINEVLTHTDAPITPPDSIELLNVSTEAIDISGWYLGDSTEATAKFQIPADTILGPGEFILFDEGDFNPTPNNPGPNDFRLDAALGDYVWLTESSNGVDIDRIIDAIQFGAAPNSESFGRAPDGSGRLTPMSRLSLGCGNPYPRVGPVVISEVQFNPPDPSAAALAIDPNIDSGDLEFIEMHNPTGQPVDMTEWRIRGGVDFDFAPGTILDSQESWIVIPFNPDNIDNADRLAAFRAHYGLAGVETILGGYGGSLSNSEDRVVLQWPDEPPMDGPDVIPRLLQDEVIYDDLAPWPTAADGDGPSLHRRAPVFYGNDVNSWQAATATPGQIDSSGNVTGDFNNDGSVNAADIDILLTAARQPSAALYLDFDGSFSVNQGDVTVFLQTIVGARYGDANLDGFVDGSDFNIWNTNKFATCNQSWANGDWNGDAIVDVSDFNIWNINKFTAAAPQAATRVISRSPRAAAGTSVIDQRVAIAASATDGQDPPTSTRSTPDADPATTAAKDHFFAIVHRRARARRLPTDGASNSRLAEEDAPVNDVLDDIPWWRLIRQRSSIRQNM